MKLTEGQKQEIESNKSFITTCYDIISQYEKVILECKERIKELEGSNLWKNIDFTSLKSGKYGVVCEKYPGLQYVVIKHDPTGRISKSFYDCKDHEIIFAQWYINEILSDNTYIHTIGGEEYGGSFNECYG